MKFSRLSYRLLSTAAFFYVPTCVAHAKSNSTSQTTIQADEKAGGGAQAPATGDIDTIIVTGTRQLNRTVTESLAPIDVLTSKELKSAGNNSVHTMLTTITPSISGQQFAGGIGGAIRVLQLRGLNSDETLILVNGKRRHATSTIFATAATTNGQSPADVDLIPASSIEHVEVLRDGASAQYGSDAIAGVINIVLKTDTSGTASLMAGTTYRRDGAEGVLDVDKGFAIGEGGYIHLSASGSMQQYTNRTGPNTSQFYATLPNGQLDPREATVNRYVNNQGEPEVGLYDLGYDAGYKGGAVEFYSFGTVSSRDAANYQSYRTPGNVNNILSIYPSGYTPTIEAHDADFQIVAGLKGMLPDQIHFDLSTSFANDKVQENVKDSLAPTQGLASPTWFYLGTSRLNEWLTNLDLQRDVDLGFGTPLSVAVGAEYRHNRYELDAGTPFSYQGLGSQGEGGIPASAAGAWTRHNTSIYFDVDQKFNRVEVDVAGRHEDYSDFGTADTGKASLRAEATDYLAFRATASTGFRAPTLQQEHYSAASNTTALVNGVAVLLPVALVTVNSPTGKALGSTPLKPETSTNYSAGFVLTPASNLNLTVDAYEILIRNRILLTSTFNGQAIVNILQATGVTNAAGGYYFTNAATTLTRGLDAVLTYNTDLGDFAKGAFSLAGDLNRTSFHGVEATPAAIAAAGIPFIGRDRIGNFTVALPRHKIIADANFTHDKWSLNVRATYYGPITAVKTAAANDDTVGPATIFDTELGYDITNNLKLSAGLKNAFDKMPPISKVANQLAGVLKYNLYAPYGANGGFYYSRITYKF